MHYLFVLRRDQPPTQEMMQFVLDGYRQQFVDVQMLGGTQHDGPLPTEPDTYVVTLCLAETKSLGFDSSRDAISYSTDMVYGEPVGVCRIHIKSAAQYSHPTPAPVPRPAEAPQAHPPPAPVPRRAEAPPAYPPLAPIPRPAEAPQAYPPLAPIPRPAEAPQAKLSAIQRIIGVFTSPGETFADVVRVPSWIAPILVLTVLSLCVSAIMVQRVDWNSFLEKQMSKSPRFEQLSSEQKAQQLSIAGKIIPYQIYATGFLVPILFALIIGAIYLGCFNLFLGARLHFKTALAITAHAQLVGLVSSPLLIIVMFLKRFGDVDPEHLLASNVGEFLSNETPKWLLKLTGSLDIFSFWLMALLVIGFAAANPKKISKAGACGVVFGVWAVYVLLLKVGLAIIFG